ncbi:hypothetical protein [Psychrobacter sp. FDAARGOS_221]|uniref:hypothetical protein n=1 Tax=Psychrobacter sp. FDAARGOS_221 TaxID=1975705 RepID=UPI000BB54321|nr:hypothetical protein [Psychrobacter sp. FDAARGOS_221]PNK60153.1 hypothetical protein A6J60_004225 [Psychrobacter sp. FDAARGOS_221]
MQWQDEQTVQDVALRENNRPDTGFLSWSNYIKQHKDDPQQRYAVAQQFLPWPLGFKESVLALRAIIREQKKQQQDYEDQLWTLYQLAAWESFYPKQSPQLDEPGFKIFVQFPGSKVTELTIDYQQLGYQQLKLLTKTDAKMLVALYGEPEQHSTLYQLYPEVWQQAEACYVSQLADTETLSPQQQTQSFNHNNTSAATVNRAGVSSAARKYMADGQPSEILWSRDKTAKKQITDDRSASKNKRRSGSRLAIGQLARKKLNQSKLKDSPIADVIKQAVTRSKPQSLLEVINTQLNQNGSKVKRIVLLIGGCTFIISKIKR